MQLARVGERVFTRGTPAWPKMWTPDAPARPRPSVPALPGQGRAGRGRRTAAARPWGGRRPLRRLAAPPPPSRAACPTPRAQPAPVLSLGAGSRKREDAQGRDPSPRPPADPSRAGIKPRPRRENPGSDFHPVAERRGRVPFAARAPAPRTQLRERGSPRADTRRPERRGSIFSCAMNRARENLPETAETFSAPGVAAAAAAA